MSIIKPTNDNSNTNDSPVECVEQQAILSDDECECAFCSADTILQFNDLYYFPFGISKMIGFTHYVPIKIV